MQHKVKAAEYIVLLKARNYLHFLKRIYPKRMRKRSTVIKKKAKPKTRMKCFEKEEEETPVCPPLANTNGPSEYLSRRSLILLWIKTKTCGEKCFNIFAILLQSHICQSDPIVCLSIGECSERQYFELDLCLSKERVVIKKNLDLRQFQFVFF